MKSGASQNFHLNQRLAEKQKVQKGIQCFGHPTSTMTKLAPVHITITNSSLKVILAQYAVSF